MLGTPPALPLDFNWNAIDPIVEDLDELGLPFYEAGIKYAIAPDKAPGSDGCTINFFRSC